MTTPARTEPPTTAPPPTSTASAASAVPRDRPDAVVDRYVAAAEAFAAARPAREPAWLRALREAALAQLAATGFPTTRQEDWRHTSLAPVSATAFRRAEAGEATLAPADVAPHGYADTHQLVFVDGHHAPDLSSVGPLPAGTLVGSLAATLASEPARLEPWLGRHARLDRQPFVALNTAFLDDGAVVWVPRGTALDVPVHLVFVATGNGSPKVSYPRNVVVVGEHGRATVVETYVGLGAGATLTCPVTEIAVGAGAAVDHYKVQQERLEAYHLATLQVVQDRDSAFATHGISTGGALVRYDANAFLDGEGVDCTLNGLYVAGGTQVVDHHMWVEHAAAHGTSRELFKGILDDRARAVFTGRIHVQRGAQQTDARQSNRNLLLSDGALVNSNPQLEIFADDVKCTHGSTVGQLDADALFYLRSRGLGEAAARSLLVYAFAGEIIAGIKPDEVRARLEQDLFARLPHGDDGPARRAR